MPDFLVSAATGALSPVVDKLAALLSDEYKRFKGVRGEVKFLIRELEAMHAFLLKKSEEENPDAQEKAWMKEVRELSYDIEDSLDDFRVRVDDNSTKPDGFIDKCKNLLAKTKARRRIAKAIQDLKTQVKEVSERNARYKQIGDTVMNTVKIQADRRHCHSSVTVDPRALAIFEDASRLVGIDQPKQEIISFLTKEDGDISSQQPKIVSIVGIGGIGKTTLANRVYEELNDLFECRVFLSVSRNPDISGILRTILIKVTGQDCYMTDIQQLIMEIKDFLRTKRYLVVVDDVWDVNTWEIIKCALPNNSSGSVIVTTTRIHDVAKACCSSYDWVYHSKPLQEDDSKILFQNRIFGPGNGCPEYLKEVFDKILKKCGGLPLAIITIGGLLATKARNGVHSVTEWDQVQTSIGHGLSRDSTVEGMRRILSLSYFDLPSHLKACLLYLSTFPEDYEIEKGRLVRLWVAEGFIPAESTCTLYESGEKSFNELINRNLILPCKIKEWTGEIDGCHLHDTILDFVMCKSTEDNFVTVHGIPGLTPPPGIKVRRLSLQDETKSGLTLGLNPNFANVRSIICCGFPCSLLGFRFLRVLDFMRYTDSLEKHHLANIGELLQLRYLGLRYNYLIELPEEIGALQYLETLDIRDCDFIQLPTTIVRLKRLVNLLMGSDYEFPNCFPSGIKNMQALEGLNRVEIDIEAAAIFVEEIGDLTKMRHLGIEFFSRSSDTLDEESYVGLIKKMVSSFQQLNKLQTLDVQFNNHLETGDDVIFKGGNIIVKVPWCSASLRRLVFKMTPIPRVPSWMKSLVNIEELELRIKKLDEKSLCILGDLPVLVDLTLEIVIKVIGGVPSTERGLLICYNRCGYRTLRRFHVSTTLIDAGRFVGILPMLTFEAGSMPKLERFFLDFDADITISATNGHLDFGLNHLSQLTMVECNISGTALSFLRVEAAIKKELGNHPKLTDLLIRHLPSYSKYDKALPLPTDLSFTIHHDATSPDLDGRHGRRRRRSKASQGTNIRERKLVKGAPKISGRVKGTSGAAPTPSDVLGPRLIAAPQQKETLVPPCFIFSSGSPPNSEAEQQAMDCYQPSQHDDLANAFTSAFNRLSLRNDHPGSSATAVEAASSDSPVEKSRKTLSEKQAQGELHIPDHVRGTSGAVPATSDVLGPQLIVAPQQQGAVAPRCFTFSSRSRPNAEAERQAMDYYKPSQHDNLANTFSTAFNALSLHDDHAGSSTTSAEAASSDTGAAPSASSDVLGPPLNAAVRQQEAFTFGSGSPPKSEAERQAMECYEPSQHDDQANAFTSAFDGLSLRNNHPGSGATSVEEASLDTGTAPATSDVLGPQLIAPPKQQEILVPSSFTFSSRSIPNFEAEQQEMNCFQLSQHDDVANAFNRLSLRDDHPGSSAMAVEAASSDIGTQTNGVRRIVVPRRRSSGRTTK